MYFFFFIVTLTINWKNVLLKIKSTEKSLVSVIGAFVFKYLSITKKSSHKADYNLELMCEKIEQMTLLVLSSFIRYLLILSTNHQLFKLKRH